MKRVLLILSLFCLMPFLGISQNNAQLEEAYGPSPYAQKVTSSMLSRGGEMTVPMYGMEMSTPDGKLYVYDADAATMSLNEVSSLEGHYFMSHELVVTATKDYVYGYTSDNRFIAFNRETSTTALNVAVTMPCTDMAYDVTTDKMYGVRNGKIYEINLTDGTLTAVHDGSVGANAWIALAIDKSGNMYGVENKYDISATKLYKINTETWVTSAKGSTGMKTKYAQSMTFDRETGVLYWWHSGKGTGTSDGFNFCTVNTTNGATTVKWANTGIQLVGLHSDYKPVKYAINYSATNGSFENQVTEAEPGTDVVVDPQAEAGFSLTALYYVKNGESTHNDIDMTTKTFVMPASKVTVYGEFNLTGHTLTIYYKYKNDGSQAAPTYTQSFAFGQSFSVPSPHVFGHNPSTDVINGVMEDNSMQYTVEYTPSTYTLTVNFTGAGDDTPATHTEPVVFNGTYNYATPAVTGYNADMTTVSGTMDTEGKTVLVTYTPKEYTLTVNYKYSNGTTAHDPDVIQVAYKSEYNVTPPTITGYTPDPATVTGVMPAANKTVEVTFLANPYWLTVNYTGAVPAVPQYKHQIECGATYNVPSPTVTGYTPDIAGFSGTMPSEDLTFDVAYTANEHTVTVNYTGAGTATPETKVVNVLFNQPYNIPSPTVTGYTPDAAAVEGTLTVDNNLEFTVNYTINKYWLTINYSGAVPAVEQYKQQYNYNQNYDVTSPAVTGYTPTPAAITGTMGAADVTETVNYTINSYDLTIHYKFIDGSQAAADYTATLNYGVPFNVESPEVTGYKPSQEFVTGVMPANDIEITVTYGVNPHMLTINYYTQEEGLAPVLFNTLYYNVDYNQAYSYPSPAMECHTANPLIVTGTMPDDNVTKTVIYTKNTHTLTVHFVDADNQQIGDDAESNVVCGNPYNVVAAPIAGYTPRDASVTGIMPDANTERTIIYDVNEYAITINPYVKDGVISAQAMAHYGETVTVMVTEDPAMELTKLTWQMIGEEPQDIDLGITEFDMPAADVVINGTFSQIGENTISLGNYNAKYDEVVTVEVALANENLVSATQMDVIFGSNFTYVNNSAVLSSRALGAAWTVGEAVIGEGATSGVRVTITNANKQAFDGEEGTIFTFQVRCGYNSAAQPTTANAITVENLTCKTPYGTTLVMEETAAGNINITSPEYTITYEQGENYTLTGAAKSTAYAEVTVEAEALECNHLTTLYYVEAGQTEQHAIDLTTKKFNMPHNNITVYATTAINVHSLTINYMAGDTPVAPSYIDDAVDCGQSYSVISPAIECMSPDQTTVNGYMIDNDLVITVNYTMNQHWLTIHYTNAENNEPIASDYSHKYQCHEGFSVNSPAVYGFSPMTATLEGTMPDADTVCTVKYTRNSYNITLGATVNGTIMTDPAGSAKYEEIVGVFTSPEAGFELATLTYTTTDTVADIMEDGFFAMPAADVTVDATFTQTGVNTLAIENQSKLYRDEVTIPVLLDNENNVAYAEMYISLGELTYNSVELNTLRAVDQTWTITAEVVTGNKLHVVANNTNNAVFVNDENKAIFSVKATAGILDSDNEMKIEGIVTKTAAGTTITTTAVTPYGHIVITSPDYTITYAEMVDGTVTGSATSKAYETVTLTVTPDACHHLESLSYTEAGSTEPVAITGNTFTMPANDVTINATFAANVHTLTINYVDQDGAQMDPTYAELQDCGTAYAIVSPDHSPAYVVDHATVAGIMPDADTTWTVTYNLNQFNITIGAHENGTLATTPAGNAIVGEEVTVTATPDECYSLATLNYVLEGTTTPVTIVDGKFNMPVGNVTVNATFTLNKHTLTVNYTGAGSYTPDTATDLIDCGTVYGEGGEYDIVLSGFTANPLHVEGIMPDADTTWTVTYTRNSYTITCAPTINGSITTDPASTALFEQEVNVSHVADPGFELSTLTYTAEGEEPVDILSEQSFIMPAANVTINATFAQIGTNTLEIADQDKFYRDEITVPVILNNENHISYAEMYITLGDELTYVAGSAALNVNRATGTSWSINAEVVGTGEATKLHVIASNTTNAYFADYAADMSIFSFKVVAGIIDSDNEMKIDNIVTKTIAGTGITTTAKVPYGHIVVTSPDYTITYAEMVNGTVTGAATSRAYETVTLTVTPDECYHLESLSYTEAGSTEPVAITGNTFEMPANNVTINATFAINIHTLTVTYTGAGAQTPAPEVINVNCGEPYYIETPIILGYTPDIAVVEGIMPDNDINVTVTYNHDLYTITYAPTANGEISGWTSAYYQEEVTIYPVADEGYHFVEAHYTAGTAAPVAIVNNTFTMPLSDITVSGTFSINEYNIYAVANPTIGGTIAGAGIYEHFTTATLVATPDPDYVFVNWTEGTEVVSTEATYSFEVTGNRNLVANFALKYYDIMVIAHSTAGSAVPGGVVTGAGTYAIHQMVTVTATPDAGFMFEFWMENGVKVSEDANYTFEALADRKLKAIFAINAYNIDAIADGAGTVYGAGLYEEGEEVTLTATPDEGNVFEGWFIDEQLVSRESTYTFIAEEDITVVAKFRGITGIEDSSRLNAEVYPNPTRGNVKVECEGIQRITIVSILGSVVYDNSVVSDSMTIDMSQFAQGAYIINIHTQNGTVSKMVTLTR